MLEMEIGDLAERVRERLRQITGYGDGDAAIESPSSSRSAVSIHILEYNASRRPLSLQSE